MAREERMKRAMQVGQLGECEDGKKGREDTDGGGKINGAEGPGLAEHGGKDGRRGYKLGHLEMGGRWTGARAQAITKNLGEDITGR